MHEALLDALVNNVLPLLTFRLADFGIDDFVDARAEVILVGVADPVCNTAALRIFVFLAAAESVTIVAGRTQNTFHVGVGISFDIFAKGAFAVCTGAWGWPVEAQRLRYTCCFRKHFLLFVIVVREYNLLRIEL